MGNGSLDDMFVSPPGALFNEKMEFYKLDIANSLLLDPTTHCDLKSGLNRALDLVVTNCLEKIEKFDIDHELAYAPFSVRFKNGSASKCMTDHKAIMMDIEVGEGMKNLSGVTREKVWSS